uniref:C-type lectin domain-containing protein n=1 Tax=Periophthalmus magnuspinnatus TaxID=409849 RepID=A0A3B3ZZG7_9GOBI
MVTPLLQYKNPVSLLLFLVLVLSGSSVHRCCGIIPHINGLEYHFINQELNWHEAQQFCRENYLDLATVTSLEEAGALNRESYTGLAWIGLLIEPASLTSTWRWTVTGDVLGDYQNWRTNVPNGATSCISTASDGMWFDHACSHPHAFLCFQGEICS